MAHVENKTLSDGRPLILGETFPASIVGGMEEAVKALPDGAVTIEQLKEVENSLQGIQEARAQLTAISLEVLEKK